MDSDSAEWIDKKLEEVHEGNIPADFDFELWLSTDSKHTVKVTSSTPEGRKAAMRYAQAVYDNLLQRYGSKQSVAVREYSKAEGKPYTEDLGKCNKCGSPNKLSMKGKVFCSAKCWLK